MTLLTTKQGENSVCTPRYRLSFFIKWLKVLSLEIITSVCKSLSVRHRSDWETDETRRSSIPTGHTAPLGLVSR